MLETVGKIIDRMSELKGLAGQDPMKSEMDKYSYNNEFKDLQMQLYSITNEQFNGVSLFANHIYATAVDKTSHEVLFNGMDQKLTLDHTVSIHTSQNGSSGAKVSIHKSMLKSALTLKMDLALAGSEKTATNGFWSKVVQPKHRPIQIQQHKLMPMLPPMVAKALPKKMRMHG